MLFPPFPRTKETQLGAALLLSEITMAINYLFHSLANKLQC